MQPLIRLGVPRRVTFGSVVRASYGRLCGKRLVHFLHVGKTGGSAIKYALGRYWTTREYALVFHNHEYTLMDVPGGDQAVVFLRDPITRFVSGFYSRLRQGQPRYFVRWTPNETIAFRHFTTPNQLAVALSSTDAERRAQAEEAMRSIGHIRDGYAKWLGSEAYLLSRVSGIFLMGFQETLTSDFIRLASTLGVPRGAALPTDDVTAHRTVGCDKALEPAAVENLHRWYAADYGLYALCQRLSERIAVRHDNLAAQDRDRRAAGNSVGA